MQYEKQEFVNGQVLTAECLNRMEEGIKGACDAVPPACSAKDCSKVLSYGKNGCEWIDLQTSVVSCPKITTIDLSASLWVGADSLYSQIVTIDGVTPRSKVDLLPSVEQLAIFHNKDVAFVTENEDGVVTVYAIGDKPLLDYTIQAQITEVEV
jgi:hypothetical protein